MTDRFASLNPDQRLAAQTVDGPVLVIAGAGTGKTQTLVYRLAYLVTEAGIPAEKLLAITFTTKAAEEMRQRVQGLCHDGMDLSSMWIGTIHSLCYEILQKERPRQKEFDAIEIISPADRAGIIRSLVKKFFPDRSTHSIRKYALEISNEKNSLISYEKLTPFCKAYQEILVQSGVLDFDDLIIRTLELFRESPGTAERLQVRFSHISVDEYQDVNASQYRLIQNLCTPVSNLCAVGDADQAIYAFRGAQVENFLNFQKDFPNAKIIYLQKNYRSTHTILSAAQQVIKKNRKRFENPLIATRPGGTEIEICQVLDEQEEAGFVAQEIERLLGGTRFETLSHDAEEWVKGFGDIAILYRLHQQGHPIKKALQQRGIPVQVATIRGFYEEPEIKPVVDFLEMIKNPHNDLALMEILTDSPWSIGPKTAEKLKVAAQWQDLTLFSFLHEGFSSEHLTQQARVRLSDFIDFYHHLVGKSKAVSLDRLIKEIWENLYRNDLKKNDFLLEMVTSAMLFSHVPAYQGIPLFLNKISLMKEGEVLAPRGEAVALMTVHGAKGLEFPVVFMVGLEQGLFPYQSEEKAYEGEDEEERRLFYVGMTRAKEKLYLLHTRSRFFLGERKKRIPSAFLNDIPTTFLKIQVKKPLRPSKKQGPKQMKLF